jgi:excisionase family DNA binding protein
MPVPVDPAERLAYLLARPTNPPAETAEITGTSLSTVRRAIDSGELPARKVGRRVHVPTVAALAWVGAVPADGSAA